MKTAIYVEDGVTQLVLTPETEFETSCFALIGKAPKQAELFEGGFYDCRGGWVRQSPHFQPYGQFDGNGNDKSLIIRVSDAPEAREP